MSYFVIHVINNTLYAYILYMQFIGNTVFQTAILLHHEIY